MHDAVVRECRALREKVGMTWMRLLGKIDIQAGVREFLAGSTQRWESLPVVRRAYGLMCTDDGMVMDDGRGTPACRQPLPDDNTPTLAAAARYWTWL